MKWKRSSDAVQRPKKGGSKPRKKPAAVTASKRSVVPAILLGSWLIALTVLLAILFMNMDPSKTGGGPTVLVKKIDTTRTPRPPEPGPPSAATADPAPATRPAQPAGTVDTTTTTTTTSSSSSSSRPEPTSPPSARPEPASPPSATPSGTAASTPSGTAASTPSGTAASTPSGTATSTPSGTAASTPSGQATPTPSGTATSTPPAAGRLAERVDRVEEKVAVVDEIRSTVDRVADEVRKQGKTLRNLDNKVGRLENAVSSIETGKPAARAPMPDSAPVRTGATASSPAVPEPRKPAARTGTRPNRTVSDRAAAEDRRSVQRRIARREAEIRRTAPGRKEAFRTRRTGPESSFGAGFPAGGRDLATSPGPPPRPQDGAFVRTPSDRPAAAGLRAGTAMRSEEAETPPGGTPVVSGGPMDYRRRPGEAPAWTAEGRRRLLERRKSSRRAEIPMTAPEGTLDTPARMPVSRYPSENETAAGSGRFRNGKRGPAPVSSRRAAVPSSPDGGAPAYFTTSIYQMAERFGKDLTPYENRHGDRDTVAPAMTIFDRP